MAQFTVKIQLTAYMSISVDADTLEEAEEKALEEAECSDWDSVNPDYEILETTNDETDETLIH